MLQHDQEGHFCDMSSASFPRRMSGVQGGLGEHKRDILKLREEVNGLTVKSASHEVDIQKFLGHS